MNNDSGIDLGNADEFTVAQKVGQLFMLAVFINDSHEEVEKVERIITEKHIGALCFFHSRASAATNFEGKKKVLFNENSYERLKTLVKKYQEAANTPLLIAIDAEWGLAMRIENTPRYPYALTLGALRHGEDLIYEVGRKIGMDCLQAGIHWNLAPVVDINSNLENPVIGYRSFGDDKEQVTQKAKAYLKGMRDVGVLNCLKHFPGHGDTKTDSHLALPVIDKSERELLKNECYPFEKLLPEHIDSIMIGHLALPQVDDSEKPATLSKKVITEILRNRLGFEGVIISDALNMHAVSKRFPEKGDLELEAFRAGMDMFCFSEHPEEAIEKIILQKDDMRIQTSFERVWKLKQKTFKLSNSENDKMLSTEQLNLEIAKNCITELFGDAHKKLVNNPYENALNLIIGNPKTNLFSTNLEEILGIETHTLAPPSLELVQNRSKNKNHIVIALFPPSVKPQNTFGFDSALLNALNDLLNLGNCSVYLFGNPLVLNLLPWNRANAYVLVYQDFPEFQKIAYQHFTGKIPALGRLPVQLKMNHHEI